MVDEITKAEETAVTPDKPFINKEAVARRQIVATVGELVQANPDKFRVVHFQSGDRGTELDIETILVYEDGDLSIRLNVEGGRGRFEQSLYVFDGSDAGRETIYRLDITREMGMQREIYQRGKAKAAGASERSDFFKALMEDWEDLPGEDNPPLLVDNFAETRVATEPFSELLQCYDEIKLPDPPLGRPFAPTLQAFAQAVKKNDKGGKGINLGKLLPGGLG